MPFIELNVFRRTARLNLFALTAGSNYDGKIATNDMEEIQFLNELDIIPGDCEIVVFPK